MAETFSDQIDFDGMVSKLSLLIRASALDRLRWVRRHLYALLVLAPIVLGVTYFTAARLASNYSDLEVSPSTTAVIASVFWLGLVLLTLSRATTEVYHVRLPESQFDSFPIADTAFFQHAAVQRATRVLAVGLVLLAARWILATADQIEGPIGVVGYGDGSRPAISQGASEAAITIEMVLALILLLAFTASTEIYGAINWIHWNHVRNLTAGMIALAALLSAAAIAGPIAALFLHGTRQPSDWLFLVLAGLGVPGFLVASHLQYKRWRLADMEFARRLRTVKSSWLPLSGLLSRKLSPSVAAEVIRDLKLTIRGFSSAVYVVTALGLLWPLALVVALGSDLFPPQEQPSSWLDATWLPDVMAVKAACLLQACTLAALVPVIVSHELPHLWLERAIGTTGLDISNGKLWYARLVSLPAVLLACAAGVLSFSVPAYYVVPLIIECGLLWWLASSIIGLFAFELPTRPGLAIVLMATVALALGAISVLAWPAGLIVYGQSMHGLTQRARIRARFYLMTEAE